MAKQFTEEVNKRNTSLIYFQKQLSIRLMMIISKTYFYVFSKIPKIDISIYMFSFRKQNLFILREFSRLLFVCVSTYIVKNRAYAFLCNFLRKKY